MAKGVQIPIEVVDKFSKQLGDMEARLNSISGAAEKQSKAFNLLSADVILRYGREAGNAIVQFGKDSVRAFEEQETANKRLQIAMQNLGVYSDSAFQKQLRFAESMQASSTFADEQVVELQATLTTFGLYGKQLEAVTKSTLDLATAQRIDLHTAAMLLGKAFVGETGALGRYGIVVDETKSKVEQFAAIKAQIDRRFGGAASAELETHAGKVKSLGNNFGELQEKVGEDLARNIDKSHGSLSKLIGLINTNYENVKKFGSAAANLVGGGLLAPIVAVTKGYQDQAAAAEEAYAAGNKARAADMAGGPAGKPPTPAADPAVEAARMSLQQQADDESSALAESSRKYIESRTMTHQQLADMDAQRMAGALQEEGQFEAAKEVMRARGLERDKVINMERIQSTRNMLNMLAALSTAKNKEIAIIGKAAAFATTMINAHVAAGAALAAFAAIPPLAVTMAGVMYAAGAAQAAMIAGVPLAEGGIAMPRSGGVMANLAENGEPEVVAPLWKLKNILGLGEGRGMGGGGTVVQFGDINVTVQAQDVGSQSDRRSLAEQLVDELRRQAAPIIEASIMMNETAARYPARAAG